MADEYSQLRVQPVKIAAGASITDPIRLDGFGLSRITTPSAWDAANLTFQIGHTEKGNFIDLYDKDGNEIVVVAAANRAIVLPPSIFGPGMFFLKIRSGTSATPVNQSVERSLSLALRPY